MTRRAVGAASGDLFEIPRPVSPLPGSLDFRATVSELISHMLAEAHRAGLDRHDVAACASRLSGKDVTKYMLDAYTSCGREEFNCPLWLAPVLEIVCKDTSLASWHAGVHGGRMSVGAEALDAEIGRLMRESELAASRLRDLKDLRRRTR